MDFQIGKKIRFEKTVERQMVRDLKQKKFTFVSAIEAKKSCFFSNADWMDFADCWNRLALDRYMGDNGTYRYRRYSQFEISDPDSGLLRLPHTSYEQPSYINKLNGGINREFDPLEDYFVDNPIFDGLLRSFAQVFDDTLGETVNWNIRLHPYRIIANDGAPGSPTPEGLHRDGVDFIVTLLVKRNNIIGGETTITDTSGSVLLTMTLTNPMDIIVADDAMTMHGVTVVEKDSREREAYRDVLVIAYTRLDR